MHNTEYYLIVVRIRLHAALVHVSTNECVYFKSLQELPVTSTKLVNTTVTKGAGWGDSGLGCSKYNNIGQVNEQTYFF